MGTPDIAVPSLERLAAEHEVVGVFCQPDKPVGRKQTLTAPAIKLAAQRLGIPVFQPLKMRDGEAKRIMEDLAPDAIALIAFGRILPKDILDVPKFCCVNAHASLLPKYRGAAPIQYALLNGDKVTGITAMRMDEGMDTGDIITSSTLAISLQDDEQSLFAKLGALAAEVFSDVLPKIERGEAIFTPQPESASFAPPIQKSDAEFSFVGDIAKDIVNKVRAFSVWPAAWFEGNGKKIKVFSARAGESTGRPGEVLAVKPLTIAAKEGSVELLEVMPESSRRMDGVAFAAGSRLKIGDSILS